MYENHKQPLRKPQLTFTHRSQQQQTALTHDISVDQMTLSTGFKCDLVVED